MTKVVIFDLDGTLYNNSCLHWLLPLTELFCLKLGYLARERKARKQMRGKHYGTEEAFYEQLFLAIDHQHPECARRWYHGHYMPLQAKILRLFCRPYDWVNPRLQELQAQGMKVALYSDYGFAKEKIQALSIDSQLFTIITDAPSLGGLKPSSVSTQKLLDLLQAQPEETLIVGDRDDTDGETARQVGAQYKIIHGSYQ